MKTYRTIFSLLGMLLGVISIGSQALATSLLPITLEQLSTRAEVIIHGAVISNQVKKDEVSGHIVTYTTFEIIDLIKDDGLQLADRKTHTIKQLGGRLENAQTTLRIQGVPDYQVGNEYVVFLPKTSSLGFCSPLGMHQGSFTVFNVDGQQLVSNGHGLLQPSAQQASGLQQTGALTSNSLSSSGGTPVSVSLAVNPANPSQSMLSDFINTVRIYNTH